MDSDGDVSFSVSAPGKVILMGEHSVLYKKRGIAASINKRTYLHFKEHRQAHDQITLNLMGLVTEWDFRSVYNAIIIEKPLTEPITEFSIFTPELIYHEEFVEMIRELVSSKVSETEPLHRSVLGLFYLILGMVWCTDVNVTPFDVEVTTELEIGSGAGSSASFSVCAAAAIYHFIRIKSFEKRGNGVFNISYETFKPFKMNLSQHYCGFSKEDKEVINKWAFCVEKIMHGTPSGLDNTVCTFGNTVLINPPERSENESNLLPMDCFPSLRLLLVDSGVTRQTSDLVKRVSENYKSCKESVGAVLNAMDVTAQEFIKLLETIRDSNEMKSLPVYRKLELLVDVQQGLLTALGVSHDNLNKICSITKKHSIHSKLTGAGGGGFAISLIPPDVSEETVTSLTDDLTASGFKVHDIIVNGEGLALDFK